MAEPEFITAGDTVEWLVPAGDYDAGTWTLTYSLASPDCDGIDLTAADDGNGDHQISELAATTVDWEAGEYYWQRYVTNGAIRHTTGRGRLTIRPNLAAAKTDMRSSAQKAFDALTAVRENKASQDQLSYSIQGRSISRMTWDEVNSAWHHFKTIVEQEIAQEQDELGESDESNTVKVSFNCV